MTTGTRTSTVTAAEIEQCRKYVEQTGDGVAAATKGLTDAQWNFKESPDRWSIAEIVEHMVFIQELVLGPVQQQLAAAPEVLRAGDFCEVEDIVTTRFPDRSVKMSAPEVARPIGRWAPAESLERMRANCGGLNDYVESSPGLRLRVIEAAPLKAMTQGAHSDMDGYQWVLAVAAHTERHTKQIREVQASPNYPR